MIDFKVALIDGKFHDVDLRFWPSKSPHGWACAKVCAAALLLEPIMKVEAVTPKNTPAASSATSVAARHGSGQDTRGNAIAIAAMVLLANMFGYINTLRSMSSGRAQFTMQFDHYDPVPQNISDEIQAKYA